MICGSVKNCMVPMTVKIAASEMACLIAGTLTRNAICTGVAPSMTAASYISRGTPCSAEYRMIML